jgi:membrane associated rhomboid family serine protease
MSVFIRRHESQPPIARPLKTWLKQWQLLHNDWIATSENGRFYAPLAHPTLKHQLYLRLKCRQRIQLRIATLLLFAATLILTYQGKGHSLAYLSSLWLVWLVFVTDYRFITKDIKLLANKAEFLAATFNHRLRLIFISLLMLITGGIQFHLVINDYTLEDCIKLYGSWYQAISAGDYWRLLTGPWLHSGLKHWLINAMLLIMLVPMTFMICRWYCLAIFIAGACCGHVFAYEYAMVSASATQAVLGVSGGVYSLLAFNMVTYCGGQKYGVKSLHKPVRLQIVFSHGVIAILPVFVGGTISHSAHMGGFVCGLIFAVVAVALGLLQRRRLN